MLVMITFISTLIAIYSVGYMHGELNGGHGHDDHSHGHAGPTSPITGIRVSSPKCRCSSFR